MAILAPDSTSMTLADAMTHVQDFVGQPVPTVEKSKTFHKFSRKLAVALNPESPDISAALVFRNLQFWKQSAQRRPFPLPKGISCYRSLREQHNDIPYLKESGINTALKRLEKALGDQFIVHREKSGMKFTLGEEIDELASKPLIQFRIADALQYGIVQAILVSHLNFARFDPERVYEWYDDIAYFEMNPTVLSRKDDSKNGKQILPMGNSTIRKALKSLTEKNIIQKHPEIPWHYGRQNYPVPAAARNQKKTEM